MSQNNLTRQRIASYLKTKDGFLPKKKGLTVPTVKLTALTLPCLVMGLENSNKLHAATVTRAINETCSAGNNNLLIDIDNAGGNDIQFQVAADGMKAGDGPALNVHIHDNPANWFRKIGFGQNIAAGAASFNVINNGFYLGITYNTSNCTAPWFANGPGFMVVKFYISGNLHMGWLALEVTDKFDVDGSCAGGSNQPGRKIKIIKAGWNTTSIAAGGTSINTPSSLPIELSAFTADSGADQISLHWITESETDNAGFELQRSTNGKDFHTLSFIEGKGTTAEQQKYYFDDKDLRDGQLYYYRLRQIDYNGQFEYSKVITAKTKAERINGSFSPNPITQQSARLVYTTPTEGELLLQVFDVTGKVLAQQTYQVIKGKNQLDVDFSLMGAGMFFVKMEQGSYRAYEKVVTE